MKCKNCDEKEAVKYSKYSTGEFCSRGCARGFSTREKRKEINEKVSEKMKGYDSKRHIFTEEDLIKGREIRKLKFKLKPKKLKKIEKRVCLNIKCDEEFYVVETSKRRFCSNSCGTTQQNNERYSNISFDKLGKKGRRTRVLKEQGNICAICDNTEWMGKPINLEMDHIDGNRQNNKRENLRMICPNCHSYTKTYRGRNINGNGRQNVVSDEEFKMALNEASSIRQALKKLGLAAYGGNYERANRLLDEKAVYANR